MNAPQSEVIEAAPIRMDSTPASLLAMAVANKTPIAELTALMDLQERWSKEQARKAFYAAKMRVQRGMPTVPKASQNTQTNSKYAKLEAINALLVPIYTAHDFSLTFSQGETAKPDHIRILGTVAHCDGHIEDPLLAKAVAQIQKSCNFLKVLGSYPNAE